MIFKTFFTNSFGILISRIFGFIRDLMSASILGANIYSDMFFVAFKLPNLFRRIFAEGAFINAFLPAFTKSKNKGIFSVHVFIRFFIFISILTVLVVIFSPLITKAFAFGFSKEQIYETAPLVSINFFYLLLIYTVTFIASLLNYRDHFATTAFSTALLNIAMIIALLLSDKDTPELTVYYLSFGVVIGGILQLLVHLLALKKYRLIPMLKGGFKYRKTKKIDKKEEEKFFKTFFHSVLGGSTAQISAFIDTWLASFLVSGSISYLYYANRIFQLPLALFAIALTIGIFPKISKLIKRMEEIEARKLLARGFWILAFLLFTSSVGGIILSNEFVKLLFERGNFTSNDSLITAKVLAMYLIGLAPFGLAKLFSLWLFSKQLQKKAAKISAIALIVNILFSVALFKPFGVVGLALAGSIGGWTLLILTILAYGFKNFLDIISNFKSLLLIITLMLEAYILILLQKKGFFEWLFMIQ